MGELVFERRQEETGHTYAAWVGNMKAALNRLQKADPATCDRYKNLMRDIDPLCDCDIAFCENAILQACLQEAIAARNNNRSGNMPMWAFYLRYGNKGHHAEVFIGARKFPVDADSPAAALLAAYLAAIGG